LSRRAIPTSFICSRFRTFTEARTGESPGSPVAQPVNKFAIAADDPNKIYLYDDRLVKKSTDGGVTFVDITRDLPPSLQYGDSTVDLDPTNSDAIYVGISGVAVYDDGVRRPAVSPLTLPAVRDRVRFYWRA
jgi:hypothetical protein